MVARPGNLRSGKCRGRASLGPSRAIAQPDAVGVQQVAVLVQESEIPEAKHLAVGALVAEPLAGPLAGPLGARQGRNQAAEASSPVATVGPLASSGILPEAASLGRREELVPVVQPVVALAAPLVGWPSRNQAAEAWSLVVQVGLMVPSGILPAAASLGQREELVLLVQPVVALAAPPGARQGHNQAAEAWS